ncbi:MAG: solute carrier family 23 protein [Oscillospiraceae bacterium]
MDNKIIIGINERPSPGKWFALSFQHVFAMFGSTVLVPMLTGLPIGTALLSSGLGTLIYIVLSKAKCPMYLGSSFAYITPICTALAMTSNPEMPNYAAVCTGLMAVGLIYCVVALLIKLIGKGWLDKVLPPVVVGPMIIVIGLGLASVACTNAGLMPGEGEPYNWQVITVAVIAVMVTALVAVFAKGFFKIVPIMSGILAGYLSAVVVDLIFNQGNPTSQLVLANLAIVANDFKTLNIIDVPTIMLPFGNSLGTKGPFFFYSIDFVALATIAPLAFVTIAEHIGDHKVLGTICGKDFLKDPGLDKTLAGDGIATFIAGMIGGPANTSYGENTGVVGMTRVASVWVTGGAAVIAILLAFIKPFQDLISSIPGCVMGGICIILFGLIAANGLRVLVDARTDFNNTRNTIIASVMLVLGLGGASIGIGKVTISGMALAALTGILLNLILPEKRGAEIVMAEGEENTNETNKAKKKSKSKKK